MLCPGIYIADNTILQAAFFNLTGIIPLDQAAAEMRDARERLDSYKTLAQS